MARVVIQLAKKGVSSTAEPMEIEIGPPRDEAELIAYAHWAAHAFADNPSANPEMDWIEHLGAEHFVLARINGRVIGGLGQIPMGQWFGGHTVPTLGLGAVVVAPEARSRGVASRLLRESLDIAARQGFSLSALYPSTHTVYRKAGYEQGGLAIRYRVPLHAIPSGKAPLTIRRLDEGGTKLMAELYAEQARRTAGNLDRSPFRWYEQFAGGEVLNRYVVERDGVAGGYLVYHQQLGSETLDREIVIRDVVALASDARRSILALLAGHRAATRFIVLDGAPADPLLVQLPNQDYVVTAYEQWLIRLVDVPAALRARGYAPEVTAKVHLDVQDDVRPANNGRFVLSLAHGQMAVEKGGEGRIRIDVRGLASIYTGYRSPFELLSSGYICGDDDGLGQLAAMFAGPTPWMSDHF